MVNLNGKVYPRTGHEGPKESTLSLTKWWGVVNSTHWPLYSWESDPIPILLDVKWASGPVWAGAENLTATGIRSSNHPAPSESLHTIFRPTNIKLDSVCIMSLQIISARISVRIFHFLHHYTNLVRAYITVYIEIAWLIWLWSLWVHSMYNLPLACLAVILQYMSSHYDSIRLEEIRILTVIFQLASQLPLHSLANRSSFLEHFLNSRLCANIFESIERHWIPKSFVQNSFVVQLWILSCRC